MNITVAEKDDLLAINQLYKKLHPTECKLENPRKHIDKAKI